MFSELLKELISLRKRTAQFRRVVGTVLVDGRDVGLEQVRAGMAWHFKRYQHEQSPEERALYGEAESQASGEGGCGEIKVLCRPVTFGAYIDSERNYTRSA